MSGWELALVIALVTAGSLLKLWNDAQDEKAERYRRDE